MARDTGSPRRHACNGTFCNQWKHKKMLAIRVVGFYLLTSILIQKLVKHGKHSVARITYTWHSHRPRSWRLDKVMLRVNPQQRELLPAMSELVQRVLITMSLWHQSQCAKKTLAKITIAQRSIHSTFVRELRIRSIISDPFLHKS